MPNQLKHNKIARIYIIKLIAVLGILSPVSARADILRSVWNYIKQYQLGIDRSTQTGADTLSFDTDATTQEKEKCETKKGHPELVNCKAKADALPSSGYGLFLAQPFKRTGLFYYDYNMSFGVRSFITRLSKDDRDRTGWPLKTYESKLYGLFSRFYIVLGVTPSSFLPDLFVSLGPAIQLTAGSTQINDTKHKVFSLDYSNLLGYAEIELVLFRFKQRGWFSLFGAADILNNSYDTNESFSSSKIDGMTNFKKTLNASSVGIRLVLPWP